MPNSVSNKQNTKLQKTSTGSSIDSVTIDIFGQDDYSFSRNMEQSSTGKWTVTLLLDTTKVPFTFIVKAYDGDKKLYEGTIENVTVETLDREIIIPVNRVNGSTELTSLPSLNGISIKRLSDKKLNLQFKVTNPNRQPLTYKLTTPTLPPSCISPFKPTN